MPLACVPHHIPLKEDNSDLTPFYTSGGSKGWSHAQQCSQQGFRTAATMYTLGSLSAIERCFAPSSAHFLRSLLWIVSRDHSLKQSLKVTGPPRTHTHSHTHARTHKSQLIINSNGLQMQIRFERLDFVFVFLQEVGFQNRFSLATEQECGRVSRRTMFFSDIRMSSTGK